MVKIVDEDENEEIYIPLCLGPLRVNFQDISVMYLCFILILHNHPEETLNESEICKG